MRTIKSEIKFIVIYLLIGFFWILFSDNIVDILFAGTDKIRIIQTYKGWFFVLVTAIVFYIIVHNAMEEDRIKQKRLELQNRNLQNLNYDLENARLEALKSAEIKSRFLANMSHEIRTPLNGVMGMMQLLNMTDLTDEQQEYLDMMEFSSRQLLELINDILDLTKIESEHVVIEDTSFDIEELLSNIVNIFTNLADISKIKFKLCIDEDIPRHLIGDENKINQVLSNLLSNAIKFTEEGKIGISVSCLEKNNGQIILKFSVIDTGIGMSKIEIRRIFNDFVQIDDSYTKKHQGAGLGLAISKRLIKLMGGKIWVESEKGTGSKFNFTIPLKIVT